MNIYKTKSGCYINMDQVRYIHTSGGNGWSVADISFSDNSILQLKDNEANAFLDYLDKHLNTVYAGWA